MQQSFTTDAALRKQINGNFSLGASDVITTWLSYFDKTSYLQLWTVYQIISNIKIWTVGITILCVECKHFSTDSEHVFIK